MKIMKKLWVLAIIFLMGFFVNSCGDDEENPTCYEACTEIQKNHLGINENCGHNGKTIQGMCECIEQTDTLHGVIIRKQNGISIANMDSTVLKINNAYENLYTMPGAQSGFKAKAGIMEIHIIPSNSVDINTQDMIALVGVNAPQMDVNGIIMGVAQIPIIQP